MKAYKSLTDAQIRQLISAGCRSQDWSRVKIRGGIENITDTEFSGDVTIGSLEGSFTLPGGVVRASGIHHARLHNVSIGDGCLIDNISNYIANYDIGAHCLIENVDLLFMDGAGRFGNGVEVSVLSETGGREVKIFDRMDAQTAYIMGYEHPSFLFRSAEPLEIGETVTVRGEINALYSSPLLPFVGSATVERDAP